MYNYMPLTVRISSLIWMECNVWVLNTAQLTNENNPGWNSTHLQGIWKAIVRTPIYPAGFNKLYHSAFWLKYSMCVAFSLSLGCWFWLLHCPLGLFVPPQEKGKWPWCPLQECRGGTNQFWWELLWKNGLAAIPGTLWALWNPVFFCLFSWSAENSQELQTSSVKSKWRSDSWRGLAGFKWRRSKHWNGKFAVEPTLGSTNSGKIIESLMLLVGTWYLTFMESIVSYSQNRQKEKVCSVILRDVSSSHFGNAFIGHTKWQQKFYNFERISHSITSKCTSMSMSIEVAWILWVMKPPLYLGDILIIVATYLVGMNVLTAISQLVCIPAWQIEGDPSV